MVGASIAVVNMPKHTLEEHCNVNNKLIPAWRRILTLVVSFIFMIAANWKTNKG